MIQLIRRTRLKEATRPIKKYLTFYLANEEYGIDLLKIKEIQGSTTGITLSKIANLPAHIKGVLYSHDIVVPIIDLRILYHLEIKESIDKVIIILNINEQQIGIVVDHVSDIVDLKDEEIKHVPNFFSIVHKSYVEGVVKTNQHLIIVLDIEKLILSDELQVTLPAKKHE